MTIRKLVHLAVLVALLVALGTPIAHAQYVEVGSTIGPEDAVEPTQAGKVGPAPLSATDLVILGYVLGKDASSSSGSSAPSGRPVARAPFRPDVRLQLADHEAFEDFLERTLPRRIDGPRPPAARQVPQVERTAPVSMAAPLPGPTLQERAWTAAFRVQMAPVLAASDAVQGHPERCGQLSAAVADVKVPPAPTSTLAQEGGASLDLASTAARMCARGKLMAMNEHLDALKLRLAAR